MFTDLKKRIKLKKTFQLKQLKFIRRFFNDNFIKQSKAIRNFFNENSSKIILNSNIETNNKKIYIDIVFKLNDDLLYYTTNNRRRFCILVTCEQKIFRMTHDEN